MIDLDAPVEKTESTRLLEVVRRGPAARRSGTEGLESFGPPDPQERVSRLVETLAHRSAEAEPENRPDPELVEQVVRGAQDGLVKAQNYDSDLNRREQLGLEAVILTDGTRPSLTVQGGFVDLAAPDVGDWALALGGFRDPIRRVIAAVGRVNFPPAPGFAGTCFLVADDLVATNRHVLEAIAVENPAGHWTFRFPGRTTVDFVGEDGSTNPTAFELTEVVFAPPDPINRTIHFPHLDFVLLRVKFPAGSARPAALQCEADLGPLGQSRELYVVGFPARPNTFFGVGTPTAGSETAAVMHSVFAWKFGVKKLAPGRVDAIPGQLAGDTKSWVFSHNSSTLGGNSGSCVVDLGIDGSRVVGIHFGGAARDENWAHSFAAVRGKVGDLGMKYV